MNDHPGPDRLQDLNQNEQQNNGDEHHIELKTLVAVTNGQVAQSATADNTRQCRVGDQCNGGDGCCRDDAGQCFGLLGADHDLPGAGAHGQ